MSSLPLILQLPDSPEAEQQAIDNLLAAFPLSVFDEADARLIVEFADFALAQMGCRSADELRARAQQLLDTHHVTSSLPEAVDALLTVAYGRPP